MRPLYLYLAGTASWFASHGIQGVMFAWLVAIVLRESPQMVGVAQMAMLLPALLFMLIGGSLADRYGGRRVAVLAQSLSLVPVLGLLFVLAAGRLTFGTMIAYALVMGLAQAFVTPARDGLLNQVSQGRIQGAVVRVTMIQFGAQLIAFVIVGLTDRIGAVTVIAVQALVLTLGAVAISRIPVAVPIRSQSDTPIWRDLYASVATGFVTVMRSVPMRLVVVQNFAVGLFFMGAYIVTIPLTVARRLRRLRRRPGDAQRGQLARSRADGISSHPRGAHTPPETRASGCSRPGGRDALRGGAWFRFPRIRGLHLSLGRLRRYRHEHGSHDHAGAGALTISEAA